VMVSCRFLTSTFFWTMSASSFWIFVSRAFSASEVSVWVFAQSAATCACSSSASFLLASLRSSISLSICTTLPMAVVSCVAADVSCPSASSCAASRAERLGLVPRDCRPRPLAHDTHASSRRA